MSQIIAISPVSRIEGHASISIFLDDAGQVADARLHVREFRGFEAFCVGRPFWEMPAITARICGICPASHALAAAMAGDCIMAVKPPPAAHQLRRLISLAQLLLSHSLSFFHLSAPDIVMGLDADPVERNIAGLARNQPGLIRKGIRLRQIGQEIVNLVGGGHLHPEHVVPGGMRQPLSGEARIAIAALLPEALELVRFALDVWHENSDRFLLEMGGCGTFPSLFLGLVGEDGCLNHACGRLRFVDAKGCVTRELTPCEYSQAIWEPVTSDSYMKPTSCSLAEDGLYRVGPLARLNVADFHDAPLASHERDLLLNGHKSNCDSLKYHHARLVEMFYAVERMIIMLDDPGICGSHVLARGGVNSLEGVGVTEAPRGTLIHHYRVDRDGLLTWINLIVATGHNSRAMDRTITDIARAHLTGDKLNEGLLNRVEHGIRLYDPCLSCATHTTAKVGLKVKLVNVWGKVLDRAFI